MIKNIPTYEKFADVIKNQKILEFAVNQDKLKLSKRFNDVIDDTTILKNVNDLISNIQKNIKILNFDDITYNCYKYKSSYQIEIYYNDIIKNDLLEIRKILDDKQILINKIFNNDEIDEFLNIEIHTNILNKIDIVSDLPIFMKGIGLGKKIYKKLIKDFGYISSYNGYEPSIESTMVWNKLTEDHDIYTFINDDNIVMFYNDVNYDTIVKKLKLFFEHGTNIIIDDDFLKKYPSFNM